jgi:hypothetical protein
MDKLLERCSLWKLTLGDTENLKRSVSNQIKLKIKTFPTKNAKTKIASLVNYTIFKKELKSFLCKFFQTKEIGWNIFQIHSNKAILFYAKTR